jgi:hypothetical protein
MAIFGAGQTRIKTTTLDLGTFGENIVLPGRLTNISLDISSDEKLAQALVDGKLKDVYSAIGAETVTATIEAQVADWWEMGFFVMDELPQVSSALPWPVYVDGVTIPGTPFEIVDTNITALNKNAIQVYRTGDNDGRNGMPFKKGIATPAVDTFFATETGTKIVFNAANEGQTIAYEVPLSYTSGETLGRESTYDTFGNLEFYGLIYMGGMPSGIGLHIYSMQRTSKANLEVNDGVPTLSTTFKCTVPAGKRSPFELVNLETLVA